MHRGVRNRENCCGEPQPTHAKWGKWMVKFNVLHGGPSLEKNMK